MSQATPTRTISFDLGTMDLSRAGERLRIDLRSIGAHEAIGVRIEILREAGWATEAINARRLIMGSEIDFTVAKSATAPAGPVAIIELDESDVSGSPTISIGCDAIEALSKVSVRAVVSVPG